MAVEFTQKLAKVNVMIPVPPLPIAHPGPYDFVVMADGQDIDRQKFLAGVMQQSPPQEPREEQPDEDQD